MASAPGRFQAPKKPFFSSYFSKQKTLTYPDSSLRSSSAGSGIVRCLAWSPLGNLIATGVGSGNSTLRIWNPEKTNIKHSTELRGHTQTIDRVAWNPGREAELASCGGDGMVRFWDVRSKSSIGQVKVGSGSSSEELINMAWAPNGDEIIVGRKVTYQVPISCSLLAIVQPTNRNGWIVG